MHAYGPPGALLDRAAVSSNTPDARVPAAPRLYSRRPAAFVLRGRATRGRATRARRAAFISASGSGIRARAVRATGHDPAWRRAVHQVAVPSRRRLCAEGIPPLCAVSGRRHLNRGRLWGSKHPPGSPAPSDLQMLPALMRYDATSMHCIKTQHAIAPEHGASAARPAGHLSQWVSRVTAPASSAVTGATGPLRVTTPRTRRASRRGTAAAPGPRRRAPPRAQLPPRRHAGRSGAGAGGRGGGRG